jgi:hypothetical protein
LSLVCGFGVCEITRPFLIVLEVAFVTLPNEQPAALIARSADVRVKPFAVGTTHALAGVLCVNVAVTLVAALIVTLQDVVPEQAPDHPVNVEPDAAAAARVTLIPLVNPCEQVEPQEIPTGELVTFPEPLPALDTVNVNCEGSTGVPVKP